MERYRRKKVIIIIALMLAISGLTIGFAAFTSVLNISSSATVTPDDSTFSVKFSTKQDSLDESAVVTSSKSDGVEVTNGVINNTAANPSISNLNATFTKPGQYAEYTFYARNEGEYKAYLNSVNFLGEKICTASDDASATLVQAACNSISISVTVANSTYSQTTTIMGHALDKKTGEKVVVRLNYASNGERADGEFSVSFETIAMVYSSIDDSTFEPPALGELESYFKSINYIMSQGAVSDSSVDFGSSTGLDVENNVAYIRSGTENDINPIYYYRGNVTKNNVIFANFCWKIVRTTETGGVKLIYNGVPAVDGSCNNTGEASQIGTSTFNTNNKSAEDVRYIYADGTDSTIKAYIDDWYEDNMTSYTSNLEDTIWCNDRTIYSTRDEPDGITTYYGAYGRLYNSPYKPSLECVEDYQMTVASTDLDKHLNYPVALLTADEMTLTGSGYRSYSTSSYLYTNVLVWNMSPGFYDANLERSNVFAINSNGAMYEFGITYSYGVRPSISLKTGTEITGTGDGSVARPYIIS